MRIPPVALFAAAAAAQAKLPRRARRHPVPTALAAGLALASAGLGLAAVARFRAAGTTVDPVDVERSSRLVQDGPNSLTRNPMYVALAVLLAAHALWRRAAWAALPVAVFVFAIDRWQIPAEEAALRARFGAAFDDYCSRVPRWLGLPEPPGRSRT
ncbi:isoprenylcysteine carboxylmethyltransferase family protein [Tessaracoccus sp. OH4464_COT-324]|uniref:methyltransferase family protein n=1 Tax=Tessaracoccus sp. OH4464_COT-324 TaxID=2491059 RepID=UPI000F641877|nr:isoprenylcysteine carboxylmethyltransferase family protein [Tessaracoccus sp. OH4464_COT-324]RRD46515.1 isoprenylcysteine carboxylmethyltransferase family protein [Tessaracoccus sp. OH4464_COT-324]